MIPRILFLLLALTASICLEAQKDFNTIYAIRVVSYTKQFDQQQVMDKIGDLGLVRFENTEINTRIYIGNYIGKRTVQKILRQVKRRGYQSAYIVEDDYELTHSTGKYNTHTYQIGAFKRLEVKNLNYLTDDLKKEFYFIYSSGVFRISVGLFDPNQAGSEERVRAIASRIGPIALSGYPRQFRKALF